MTLLLDIRQPEWMTEAHLRDELQPLLPDVRIRCGAEDGPLDDVEMLAVVVLHPDIIARLPRLRLVQKLGAGVDSIVANPALPPDVRVTRLAPEAPAQEIAEYCLAYVLYHQRNIGIHATESAARRWTPLGPREVHKTRITVLGLGHIGGRTARLFASLGFEVTGWSRAPKTIDNVRCVAGADALPDAISDADYVLSILPSTPATQDLFDAPMLARMKPGAVLINAGRGDLIVDADLLSALASGTPAHAVLDVFRQEPLPPAHPFWQNERVTITPHVSGWHLGDGLRDAAENYHRLKAGEPLLHEVNRALGY